MKVAKAVTVRVLVLVVAMLAAIGSWEIYRGTVLTAQGGLGGTPAFDHFVCYEIEGRDEDPKFKAVVQIQNQLEASSVVTVKDDDRLLCVPTAKTLISISARDSESDSDSHRDRRGR